MSENDDSERPGSSSDYTPVFGVPIPRGLDQETSQKVDAWAKNVLALKKISETLVEHKVRLENGVKVFAEIRADVEQLKPKKTNWAAIIGGAFSVAIVVLGTWWFVATEFAARPTSSRVEEMLKAHDIDDIQRLREEQARMREEIRGIRDLLLDLRQSLKAKP